MPQGKGTYGSQVGRPPKKDKYKYGGNVDPFSARNEEGIGMEKAKELVEQKNMQEQFTENMGITISNAQDRTQSMPDTEKYDKGGKVRDTSKKALEKHWKESVGEEVKGALEGRIKSTPKRGTKHDKPDKPYNITDVVKTVGRKEAIKKGYKEYWDKENKAIKKKKGKK